MKKIILLLLPFLITGCYDYKEVNDLAFISTILIDYTDKYTITYEILDTSNANKDTNEIKPSYITIESDNITDNFNNLTSKISKKAYYNHLKNIIISNNTFPKLKEISDYIIRNPDITNEIYLTTTSNINNILNNNINDTLSDYITNLLESNNINNNFEDSYLKLNTNNTSYFINIENNNTIEITGINIFNNYNYITYLNNEEYHLYNLINENKSNLILNYNDISINIYNSYLDNNNLFLEGEIILNTSNINLKDENEYNNLNNLFKDLINTKINDLNTKLNNNKNYNITLKINKKGLIFGDKYE